MDKRNKLRENRFSYKIRKGKKIFIYFDNKEIMIIKDLEAQELIRTLENEDEYEIQHYLAILTGHFKHGNERVSKNKERMKRRKNESRTFNH